MSGDSICSMTASPAQLREALRRACRRDEAACVAALVSELESMALDRQAIAGRARTLVEGVRRRRQGASGVDHLMHEFSLGSPEGVALMCLAEALLRIPDQATVDRLIRDKISRGDWKAHLGHSPSLFVNATTWGLMLTGKLVAAYHEDELGNALTRILVRGGEPLVRAAVDFAMRQLGQQFVMGETIAAALARSEGNEAKGYTHSFDMLGEAALTSADAEGYYQAYESAIHAIGQASGERGVRAGPGISVKLSALHPRYTRRQRARVMAELGPRLNGLARLAKHYDIGLNIDAEEADRLELSLDLLESLLADPELAGWEGLGFVVQAYQKRCPFVIELLIGLARHHRRRLMVRLVKGAYWDSEIKRAQIDGLADYPVFTRKPHTDLCYLAGASRLLDAPDAIYPQFATHNAHTLATIVELARQRGVADYEFQCLHGMGEALYDQLVGAATPAQRCRIYAPVGSHETLLPYLVRRLLENGANSSFVNRLVDPAVSVEQLVEDPLEQVKRQGGTRHPAIPLPRDLYGTGRVNSAGLDLADEGTLAMLDTELARLAGKSWRASPIVAGSHAIDGDESAGEAPGRPIINPSRSDDRVGTVVEAGPREIEQALSQSAEFAESWHRTPPAERAAALRRMAELLEENRLPLLSLCIREAGKTISNALGEVREATDFCRYYAQQLIEGHFQAPEVAPGPVVCISPWNFPLAIFIGQISAALAAGSPVLAKPAEQTPLIAGFAIALLHRAGIPVTALQFLPGQGETVGAALTADGRVRGVVFTGSTEVARQINRSIAPRDDVRLIAETGGQNAMIVDSSALPEQVVQDVLTSGFDSAGQRCSALRVLCLQADVADRIVALLKAAMQELVVGDPARLATDIGPVIERAAKAGLIAHIEQMRYLGRPVFQWPLPVAEEAGCFVAPTLIEIDSLADLRQEVFGPVVHVLRFAGDRLAELVEEINALGYGLTLGLHSRIDRTIDQVTRTARVGNIYVNRNMVGAVVGVQPFGGEGLSGTGPKAGGPLYLHRLADSERVGPVEIGGCPDEARPPPDSAFERLAGWASASGAADLVRRCAIYREQTLRYTRIGLPGPTGESNTLSFAGRGRLLCVASGTDALLGALAAVFATGNRAVAIDDALSRAVLGQLPGDLASEIELRPAADYSSLAGVLFDGDGDGLAKLRQVLADQPGPLLTLVQPGRRSRCFPLFRLLAERVVSVNTAAAGGNAALMMLNA